MTNEWISVEDRLPDESFDCSFLVHCDYGACKECDVAYLDEDNRWRDERFDRVVPVTHWRPLPPPPEV